MKQSYRTRSKEIPRDSKNRKKIPKKKEDCLRELQDSMKGNNIHIIGKLEREKEKQEIENLFKKVMMEYFPDLMSEQTTQL